MSGEHTVKAQDKLEVELKKFLEEVISKIEKVPADKIGFEKPEDGSTYNVFGIKAKHRINDIIKIKNKDRSLFYTVNIYYPEDVDSEEWTEQHRKEMFFSISFTEGNNRYYIVVNSADSKNFANYEVTVYMRQSRSIHLPSDPAYRIAYYFLAALTEREEYKFVDNLIERAKNLVLRCKTTRDAIDTILNCKQEFLSIISDAINIGNTE